MVIHRLVVRRGLDTAVLQTAIAVLYDATVVSKLGHNFHATTAVLETKKNPQ